MKKLITKNGVTPQSQSLSGCEPESEQIRRTVVGRRSFLKGLGAASALLVPATALLLTKQAKALEDKDPEPSDDNGGKLSKGDASILRFLCAAEILESDLWEQYWELGGIQPGTKNNPDEDFASPNPATGKKPNVTGGNPLYSGALTILDSDMPQYIQDNTDDEFSHANFLLAYLKFKGANTEDLDLLVGGRFRTLAGSTATGAVPKRGRLTNLMKLAVDTSYWSRYRSDKHNPDLPDGFTFPQAVKNLNFGEHPAIPRSDADTAGSKLNPDGTVDPAKITDHLKAIAFTAGFHFGFIEQGGTSLYPSLAQRVTDPEVLRIVLSIGPTETMHFQTWQDKAGNATPLSNVDGLTFIDLHASTNELLQANLIMPEPTPFLSTGFPICSIIRPTKTAGAAMGAATALTADGLFKGQSEDFFELLADLASDADQAKRE